MVVRDINMAKLSVILYEPEIPPNTGNIIRLCANTGVNLHLIKPLGFKMDDKELVRAGLDYHEWADVKLWDSFKECYEAINPNRVYLMTTKGCRNFYEVSFASGDVLVFGPESRGLPNDLLESFPSNQRCRLPMTQNGRSLNLSNTVAISVYEAWRQFDFCNLG